MGKMELMQGICKDLGRVPTRQEAFDYAARAVLRQGKPGGLRHATGFICQYISGENRCAIGWLLSREEAEIAQREGEGCGIAELAPHLLPDFIAQDWRFYAMLQKAHDSAARRPAFLNEFRAEMSYFAEEFGLDVRKDVWEGFAK